MGRSFVRSRGVVARGAFAPLGLLAALVLAVAPAARAAAEGRCSSHDPLRRPFFGDTHVHTAFSFDAATQDTRNTPRDAYRFAQGAEVGLQPYDADGKPLRHAKLRRPLDFTVVTDHQEGLGEVRICKDPNAPGHDADFCWFYNRFGPLAFSAFALRTIVGKDRWNFCGADDHVCLEQAAKVWGEIQGAAEEAYDRTPACRFTSFVGYEWTGSGDGGVNLHHNVVFANDKVPPLPPSAVEAHSAWDLWKQLQAQCIDGIPGCDVLTIPHNSNLSGPGLMFVSAKFSGAPGEKPPAIDAEEARLRSRWEPLIEIMQHKGDSECRIEGDTTDEACGFEKLSYNSFAGVGRFRALNLGIDLTPTRKAMVREALKDGLALQQKLGANPFKYGIVASTDTHLGTPGLTLEDDPKGHGGAGAAGGGNQVRLPDDPEFSPGGLAVVWAEENSRESLFAAMKRREAYGTSGTRPLVRFFGGWDYAASMCDDPKFVAEGYERGVPMGGDLPKRPAEGAGAPSFAVWALQDPGTKGHPGTPLQRVQVVKGWLGADGKTHEHVYDVAGGDNGASVDLATCERRGTGARQLCSVWSDPEFDAGQHAFYYARVLENPSCRWNQHLCVKAKVDCSDPAKVPPGMAACCSPDVKKTVQERAWTSPIWYSPGS